ncbi:MULTISPECIES: DUF2382 domain-containing protein [unclassified Rothia (in: high G+C Gram-positive bacteria)]|uniref:DUF2382 domain-containing protein n=1 Tax=unclassified Rothia (in: high G+C Gram-positive bacteria) TaxID=2689056 RepID=UPI00195D0394|nr:MULTISPECIES: PRC and DUF2382 domain-containing protein [unclassified Rothia (in: high G+C Gram-positive bacteria)]MBM7051346.1 PRC and DUF2382 domain-containing protein [Rothia sp. ZJ1223]QRZ61140.1 PRC and DUF2382 domain-containing protein [Rothia sp. ZJ932]
MANTSIENLRNSVVVATDGEKIGKVGEVYLDADNSQPTFVTVATGLFGANETFVPLNNAQYNGDEIVVPFSKDFVKDAPSIAEDGELSPAEEQRLYEYYSLSAAPVAGDRDVHATETATTTAGVAGTEAHADAHRDVDAHEGDVVAHEERLNVSTATSARETGKVRLRKVVHTDTETVEVPVRREEIVVERSEVRDGEVVEGYDFDSAEARADVTVTAHEERPVVSTETVATERVSLGKEVHTETERVSADVRKEEIIVEGDEQNRKF